jgi:hypothetical protein
MSEILIYIHFKENFKYRKGSLTNNLFILNSELNMFVAYMSFDNKLLLIKITFVLSRKQNRKYINYNYVMPV